MEKGYPKSCAGFKKCHVRFQLVLPASGVFPSERKMKGSLKISIDLSSFLNPLIKNTLWIEMHVPTLMIFLCLIQFRKLAVNMEQFRIY